MKVISVENASKKFVLAHQRSSNLADAARGLFSRTNREDFWALKDVSFDVEQGEAIGIIGHNGAGKSTMLKLLTRIMYPTTGRIRTRGRVSALIEVGAGFHPEMTGRENIYLNGSILGMSRREILSKFDDIVAFAEIERFIDTPVKRYSSGMYARLGFAVAAHVDPEVLLVDEVLSVGDAAFQTKCAKKMREARSKGVTIVFVSHNFAAITNICDRVIGLSNGRVFVNDTAVAGVARYRELLLGEHSTEGGPTGGFPPVEGSPLEITSMESISAAGPWQAYSDQPWTLKMGLVAHDTVQSPEIIFSVANEDGTVLFQPCTIDYGMTPDVDGKTSLEFKVDRLPLLPGKYTISITAWPYYRDWCSYDFSVKPYVGPDGDGGPGIRAGLVKLDGRWVWTTE